MKKSLMLVLAAAASGAYGFDPRVQQRANWVVGQTVQTSSGPVSGHPAPNATEVSVYLGIPYAKPPTGNLRFAAPEKFSGTAPLNGSQLGAVCPVQGSTGPPPTLSAIKAANVSSVGISLLEFLSGGNTVQSEDCLFLNVWTKPQTGDAKKAVLVWIYGGGFSSGSSSLPFYDGANLADTEDIVLVTFNYRLSVLGFPGGPVGTQNLGLLDQRLAVEWVRDNIANFGGDPSRITLFGQSAGSASVDFYSYAWNSDPIAAGFVAESGTVFSWGLPFRVADTSKYWFNVSAKVGCGDASSNATEVLGCMRTKNFTDILNAVPPPSDVQSSALSIFGPTVDNKVVFANYSERTPANVPLLIGNNNYEAGLFRIDLALVGEFFPDRFWDAFNLQEFTCPAGIRANVSVAAKNPTWRYRYFGVFPDLAPSPQAGSYHAAELPLIFDNLPPIDPKPTAEELSIGSYMRGAWAAFAKDPSKGLITYGGGWPLYDAGRETLIRLAYNNITGTNLVQPAVYDADCIYVNVSNTNASAYLTVPTPTATAGGQSGPTSVGNQTATTSGPPAYAPTVPPTAGTGAVSVSTTLLLAGLLAAMLGVGVY